VCRGLVFESDIDAHLTSSIIPNMH
jgi:hypothetical protein